MEKLKSLILFTIRVVYNNLTGISGMELWTGMLEYVMNEIAHVQYDLIHKEYEMVEIECSSSGCKSLPDKAGCFKWDSECLNFKSISLCLHTVAVAECNNSLNQHITHFQKQHKKPNVTAVGLHDIPAGCGKKGGVPSRKRRKKEAVVEQVD